MQEYRYYYSELELKYHDTGNGWIFVLLSAWKNSVNAIIRCIGMLLSLYALKSLNSIKRIQPKICVTINSNLYTMIIISKDENNKSCLCNVTFQIKKRGKTMDLHQPK